MGRPKKKRPYVGNPEDPLALTPLLVAYLAHLGGLFVGYLYLRFSAAHGIDRLRRRSRRHAGRNRASSRRL